MSLSAATCIINSFNLFLNLFLQCFSIERLGQKHLTGGVWNHLVASQCQWSGKGNVYYPCLPKPQTLPKIHTLVLMMGNWDPIAYFLSLKKKKGIWEAKRQRWRDRMNTFHLLVLSTDACSRQAELKLGVATQTSFLIWVARTQLFEPSLAVCALSES